MAHTCFPGKWRSPLWRARAAGGGGAGGDHHGTSLARSQKATIQQRPVPYHYSERTQTPRLCNERGLAKCTTEQHKVQTTRGPMKTNSFGRNRWGIAEGTRAPLYQHTREHATPLSHLKAADESFRHGTASLRVSIASQSNRAPIDGKGYHQALGTARRGPEQRPTKAADAPKELLRCYVRRCCADDPPAK